VDHKAGSVDCLEIIATPAEQGVGRYDAVLQDDVG